MIYLLLVCAMCAVAASAQVVKGDMNGDGNIDVTDLNETVNTLLGIKPLQYVFDHVVKGDMNEDGVIDVTDLNDILNTILGIKPLQYLEGHEYVDLGLPSGTLWATTNVGATKPEDYGLYFAWGETTGYTSDTDDGHSFKWVNYKWSNGSAYKITKYCTSTSYWDSSLGTSPDNKTVLDAEDDAATANWGSGWRMPSLAQFEELYNRSYTTTEWTTVNGVYGRKITSKSNGNSIFLPAAGYRNGTSLDGEGSDGRYWSRELNSSGSYAAYYLGFSSSSIGWNCYGRYGGRSVRAVRVPSE